MTFVNSDRHLIELFLRFLDAVGVEPSRRGYRVSIHETADIDASVRYWADVVGLPPEAFARATINRHRPTTNRLNQGENYHGCLVITVRQSAELYRRIEGWTKALALGEAPTGSGAGDTARCPQQ